MVKRLPLHLGVVAVEKGAFESPSTKVTNNNIADGFTIDTKFYLFHWIAL